MSSLVSDQQQQHFTLYPSTRKTIRLQEKTARRSFSSTCSLQHSFSSSALRPPLPRHSRVAEAAAAREVVMARAVVTAVVTVTGELSVHSTSHMTTSWHLTDGYSHLPAPAAAVTAAATVVPPTSLAPPVPCTPTLSAAPLMSLESLTSTARTVSYFHPASCLGQPTDQTFSSLCHPRQRRCLPGRLRHRWQDRSLLCHPCCK